MLPYPVIQRLPQYLSHVMELSDQKLEWVSSARISKDLGFTPSTIRQDLSHLNLQGVSKRGYRISELEKALRAELGVNRIHRVTIVGAGHLGTALALHGELTRYGFKVCAIFDNSSNVIGSKIGALRVRSMKSMPKTLKQMKIKIAVIAVPSSVAQEVVDQLIPAGINGILNLAYCVLRVPDDVVVSDIRILQRFQEIPCLINKNKKRLKSESRRK